MPGKAFTDYRTLDSNIGLFAVSVLYWASLNSRTNIAQWISRVWRSLKTLIDYLSNSSWVCSSRSRSYRCAGMRSLPSSRCISLFSSKLFSTGSTFRSALEATKKKHKLKIFNRLPTKASCNGQWAELKTPLNRKLCPPVSWSLISPDMRLKMIHFKVLHETN